MSTIVVGRTTAISDLVDTTLLVPAWVVYACLQEQDNEQQREGAGGEMKVEDAES